jgi:hypothetical protein
LKREIDFLKGTGARDPEIDSWLIMAPQRKISRDDVETKINGHTLSVFDRSLVDGERVGVITEPRHRIAAEYASLGRRKDETKDPISNMSSGGKKLHRQKQATMLLYPLRTQKEKKAPIHAGFALFFPPNSIATPLVFGVSDPRHRDAVIVAARP